MRTTSCWTAFCLVGLLGSGCGSGGQDSGSSGVDLKQAFALSETDSGKLVHSVWEKESDTWYTTYLVINADRTSGFLCNTDGKSVSTDVTFMKIDGRMAMTGKPGHGEGPDFVEYIDQVSFDGDKLVITGEEKGYPYTQVFRPIEQLPQLCQQIRNGEREF